MSNIKWAAGLVSTNTLSAYPTSKLEDISILELNSNPTGLSIYEVTETIVPVVTETSYLLLYFPLDPYVPGNFVCVSSSGALLTPTALSTATIGETSIGIDAGVNRIRIDGTVHAGNTLTLTYKTGVSGITPTLFGLLWGHVVDMQTEKTVDGLKVDTLVGEAMDKVFCYHGPDGKLLKVGTPTIDLPPQLFCPSNTVALTATAYRKGIVTVDVNLPANQLILCGRNSKPTWLGDGSANKLLTGDPMFPVGYRNGASQTSLLLDIGYQIGWMT